MGNSQGSHAAAGGAEYPTPKQLKEFWTQVAIGRITKESFQEFLLGGCVKVTGLSPRAVMGLTRHWNLAYPSKGHIVMEVLGPFYSPRYKWELKPAETWVREQRTSMIFWRSVTDVHFITPQNLADELTEVRPETWMRSGEPMLFDDELGNSLHKEYYKILSEQLTPRGFNALSSWSDRYSLCHERFREPRGVSLDKNVQPEFLKTLPEAWRISERPGDYMGTSPHRHSLWDCLKENLKSGFENTFQCAAGFRLLKDNSKDFRPLLRMWRSGNLPLGFDKNHRLLVLCSSK